MSTRKLKVGDTVFISNIDKKEIIELVISFIDDKPGGLLMGNYSATQLCIPNNSKNINISLRDACVDFGINVIHPMRF